MRLTKVEKYVADDGKVFHHNAKKKLDIKSVITECDNVVLAAKDGCQSICNKIESVQIGKEVLCVADKSLEDLVLEIEKAIKTIPGKGIEPTMEQVKKEAKKAFNKLQEEENERAKEECEAHNRECEL